MNYDIFYMKKAINEAKKALKYDEVPVGAVIVKDGKIIGRGYNKREILNLSTAHAEINAINKACKKTGAWRLSGCTLYVTLEPCPMCGGAVINSRIDRVVFGAFEPKSGSFGTAVDLSKVKNYNHHPEITGGVLENECASLLSDFFKKLRIR